MHPSPAILLQDYLQGLSFAQHVARRLNSVPDQPASPQSRWNWRLNAFIIAGAIWSDSECRWIGLQCDRCPKDGTRYERHDDCGQKSHCNGAKHHPSPVINDPDQRFEVEHVSGRVIAAAAGDSVTPPADKHLLARSAHLVRVDLYSPQMPRRFYSRADVRMA